MRATVDMLVVDGTIISLAEPQIIQLNRSTADRLTGRFGSQSLTQAVVEVIVDSTQVIAINLKGGRTNVYCNDY
ncbi:hypothetical protein [Spirosoma aerolatum]|uniref:hypothetical protein n=1 Tax=Spirosoma aerolatum TaxID=1211326 RepID=UPI0015D091AE|nr:hypothetical protein [Spirosoma aerolatum]